jgi:tetratricopeptide (TPR) repeat protein
MLPQRFYLGIFIAAGLGQLALADTYPLILRGKVMMKDGSPPPKSVSIQRICSDELGNAPGPLTDKKGEYMWRMDVDPMRTRACFLEANLAGYSSTTIDISALNGYTDTSQTLPPIILSNRSADPYTIVESANGVPGKSAGPWKAAMKAVDSGNLAEATSQLQAVVDASPKFAQGWHTPGIVLQTRGMFDKAEDAWRHAIENDPKLLPAYVGLLRMCIKTKDWQGAVTAADGLAKVDTKKLFPEVYLHLAVARYGLKDLDGALASAQDAVKQDAQQKRGEYVLGRILEAKGDTAGAREHMNKYLSLDPNVADVELIRQHIEYLGKPEAATVDPDLVLP